MRYVNSVFGLLALFFATSTAHAAGSCSSFAIIESFDESAMTIEVSHEKGKVRKFFPKPDGTPAGPSKIPDKCKSKVKKAKPLHVKASGGRLSITQIRSNFHGKMLNDADDTAWLPARLNELIESKTKVVIVIRQAPGGKKAPYGVNTIYMPANDEDLAEIKRIEDQGEDL